MAELADAHGSGPCEGYFMEVRVLLPAPTQKEIGFNLSLFVFYKGARGREPAKARTDEKQSTGLFLSERPKPPE